jgi:hypothetical protein
MPKTVVKIITFSHSHPLWQLSKKDQNGQTDTHPIAYFSIVKSLGTKVAHYRNWG